MVPEGWRHGKFRDLIAQLDSGVSVNGENRAMREEEIGVLKVSAVSYGSFDQGQYKTVIKEDKDRTRLNPKKGQIIISRSNTEDLVGACAYIEATCPSLFLPDKLWQTVPQPDVELDMKWLAYLLSAPHARHRLSKLATGTSGSMKNITKDELLSLDIKIPPITEQKKIARILSTWDKAIGTVEKIIKNSKTQKKALMQQLLTGKRRIPGFENEQWLSGKLDEFLKNIFGGGTPSRTVERYWRGTIPWVTVKDLISPVINGAQETITEEGLSESASNLVPAGSVIIATRMAVGKAVVATCDVAINQDLKAIIPVGKLCPRYLHFWLILREQEISRQSGGSTVKGISLGQLKALSIDIPPTLEEQGLIVKRLEQSSSLVLSLEEELRLLRQQKEALMQQLLTGKRRVKVDES